LVSLQLSLSPVRVFAIRIELALTMPVDRLQHSHLSEDHRPNLFAQPAAHYPLESFSNAVYR